jgi:hypothetical protein
MSASTEPLVQFTQYESDLAKKLESAEQKVAELAQLTLDQQHFNARLVAEAEIAERQIAEARADLEQARDRTDEYMREVERRDELLHGADQELKDAHAERDAARAEAERAKAEVARLREALQPLLQDIKEAAETDTEWEAVDAALSSSSDAWLKEHDEQTRRLALEEAAKHFEAVPHYVIDGIHPVLVPFGGVAADVLRTLAVGEHLPASEGLGGVVTLAERAAYARDARSVRAFVHQLQRLRESSMVAVGDGTFLMALRDNQDWAHFDALCREAIRALKPKDEPAAPKCPTCGGNGWLAAPEEPVACPDCAKGRT